MDPVSVLGIASGVITFVDFATKVISTSKEIFQSTQCATLDNCTLEDVCERLRNLSARLENQAKGLLKPPEASGILSRKQYTVDVAELRDISKKCRTDSEELLQHLQSYKTKNSKSRLRGAIKAAFMKQLGEGKITAMKDRLEYAQRIMSLQINAIIWLVVSYKFPPLFCMNVGFHD
jgi:hypothetical protein